MLDARNVNNICDDVEHQRAYFGLSQVEHKLDTRVRADGVGEELSAISDEMAQPCSPGRSEELLDQATRLFTRQRVGAVIGVELGRFRDIPIYNTAARTLDTDAFSGVVLYQDLNLRVSVVCLTGIDHALRKRANSGSSRLGITVQGGDTHMRFLQAGNATLRVCEARPFARDESLDHRELAATRFVPVADDETLFLQGGIHGMTVDSMTGSMVFILAANLNTRTSINAHYLVETGKLHSFTASSVKTSRVQILGTLLRELGGVGYQEVADLLDHPDHFVRWNLMRELLAWDRDPSLELLRSMSASDPHPQTRAVAAQTLKMIEEGEI